MRLGAMGDILHALPAVAALRQAHPGWYLGWAVEPRWGPLLSADDGQMPLVNRIHLVKAKDWARSPFRTQRCGRSVHCVALCAPNATICASICRALFVRLSPDGWRERRG